MGEGNPKGWTSGCIPDLISNIGVFSDGDWVESKDQDPNGDVRLIQLADIGVTDFRNKSERYLTSEKAVELRCTYLKENDILVARMPDPLGRACLFPLSGKYVTVVDVAIIRPACEAKWLMYIINSPEVANEIFKNASGSTRLRISRKNLSLINIPIPPLPEQKRIVTKLDALFGHLDTLKTKLDRIPELLKNFRQQVLTLALTGRLTQEWRSNISGERKQLEEWNKVNIGSLGSWSGGGTPSKSKKEYWTGGTIPWITPKDMKSKFLNTSQDLITKESINKSSAKLIDKDSVLIVTRSGILRRILPVAINTAKCAINQDLKALSLNKGIYPKFILYAFIGLDQDIRSKCMKAGTTVESIEFSFLKDYELKLPNYNEQLEIVKRIESLFDLADRIESQHQSLKERVEYLPQAILNKAFIGELVPQDSNDEPAGELLKRIQKEKGGKKK